MLKRSREQQATLPEQGAQGTRPGRAWPARCRIIAFMLPMSLLYALVRDLMAGGAAGKRTGALCLRLRRLLCPDPSDDVVRSITATYFTTYQESGMRRLTLAERLRKTSAVLLRQDATWPT